MASKKDVSEKYLWMKSSHWRDADAKHWWAGYKARRAEVLSGSINVPNDLSADELLAWKSGYEYRKEMYE